MRVLKSFDVEVKRGALLDVCAGPWGAYLVGVEDGRGVVIFINEGGEEKRVYLEGEFVNKYGSYVDAAHKCIVAPWRVFVFTTRMAYLFTYRLIEVSSTVVDGWNYAEGGLPDLENLAVLYRDPSLYFISPAGISLYNVDTKFVKRAWRRVGADRCLDRFYSSGWERFQLLVDERGGMYIALKYYCVVDHIHDYAFVSELDYYQQPCATPDIPEEKRDWFLGECDPDEAVEVKYFDVEFSLGAVYDEELNIVMGIDPHSYEVPVEELEKAIGSRIVFNKGVWFSDAHKVKCNWETCVKPDFEKAYRLLDAYAGGWTPVSLDVIGRRVYALTESAEEKEPGRFEVKDATYRLYKLKI